MAADYDEYGIGGVVERLWNQSLQSAFGRYANNSRQVFESSFGKWALITAGAIMAVAALTTVAPLGVTLGQGAMIGLGKALWALADPVSWIAIIGGGIIGGKIEAAYAPPRMTPAEAERKAIYLEESRLRQQEAARSAAENNTNGVGNGAAAWRNAEAARATGTAANGRG